MRNCTARSELTFEADGDDRTMDASNRTTGLYMVRPNGETNSKLVLKNMAGKNGDQSSCAPDKSDKPDAT